MPRVSPALVKEVLSGMGMPPIPVDLSAVFAAISAAEGGDLAAIVPEDKGGSSWGLWQVYDKSYPDIAAKIKGIIGAGDTQVASVEAQARAAMPAMKEATRDALIAAQTLVQRGFAINEETIAVLIDTAWNRGGGKVIEWSKNTATGLVNEVSKRANRFLGYYRTLIDTSIGFGEMALAVLALFLIAKWAGKK